MSATGFLDVCGFLPAAGGTADFVVASAITGYQTPASAGAVNGAVYSYRAQSSDMSEWEIGFGAYATGTTKLARTTVVASSTGSKVNFSAPPSVYVTALSADLWPSRTSYTPTVTSNSGSFTSVSATGYYFKIGNLLFVEMLIAITGNGSAAGYISASLPMSTDSRQYVFAGRETASNGLMLQGIANGSSVGIFKYDNTYPGGNGYLLRMNGVYGV